MSDYIKKEDAMKAICKRCLIENDICQHHWNCPYLGEISQVTAIEVVPKDFHDKTCEAMAKRHTEEIQRLMPKRENDQDIVKCEKCIYWKEDAPSYIPYCPRISFRTRSDFFCGWGIRKD